MRALGANLIEHGVDFSAAHDYAQAQAKDLQIHFVPSFDRNLVIGVATLGMELLHAVPDLDAIYVPIGLGSEICGVIAARNLLGLRTEIIGVGAANAACYYQAFESGKAVETVSANTIADGVAVRIPDAEALTIICNDVSRIVPVAEGEIINAIHHYFDDAHQLIEAAGAITLAALLLEKQKMKNKKVALIASGANIDKELFTKILNR